MIMSPTCPCFHRYSYLQQHLGSIAVVPHLSLALVCQHIHAKKIHHVFLVVQAMSAHASCYSCLSRICCPRHLPCNLRVKHSCFISARSKNSECEAIGGYSFICDSKSSHFSIGMALPPPPGLANKVAA